MNSAEKNICEESEFEKLFSEQSEPLKNYLYYLTGDKERAEDHLQNSFVALWKNCSKVAVDSAAPYLFRVAKNFFLKEVRHEKVKISFVKQNPVESPTLSSDEAMLTSEFEEALERAIGDLTEGQREVFLMSRIDKLKYHEIASKLELSVKAVEKRMHLALKSLNEALSEFDVRKF